MVYGVYVHIMCMGVCASLEITVGALSIGRNRHLTKPKTYTGSTNRKPSWSVVLLDTGN